MAKTITVRVYNNIYSIFKKAADGQKITTSNYIEYATLNYAVNGATVSTRVCGLSRFCCHFASTLCTVQLAPIE